MLIGGAWSGSTDSAPAEGLGRRHLSDEDVSRLQRLQDKATVEPLRMWGQPPARLPSPRAQESIQSRYSTAMLDPGSSLSRRRGEQCGLDPAGGEWRLAQADSGRVKDRVADGGDRWAAGGLARSA